MHAKYSDNLLITNRIKNVPYFLIQVSRRSYIFPFLIMFYYNYIGIAITIIHQIILVAEEYNLDCLHQRGVQKLSWLRPFIKHQQMTLRPATLLILSVLQDARLGMIFIQTTIF